VTSLSYSLMGFCEDKVAEVIKVSMVNSISKVIKRAGCHLAA
jgi:hypothetical protein